MKAIQYDRYGSPDVLEFRDVEKPVPKDDQVLIRVHAASVNAYDWHNLTADIFLIRFMGGGLLRPKDPRLGADVAGTVEAVGSEITLLKPGDEVMGMVRGGFAEYATAPEKALVMKPENTTFEEAAALPMASVTALQGLRDEGHIKSGQRILVNGASGGVGTFAVQIAKSYGTEVTAVCSTGNLKQAASIGADHVIDYTKEDFTKGGKQYHLIFAANGYHSLSDYKSALTPRGIYVMAGGTKRQIFQSMFFGPIRSKKNGRKLRGVMARASRSDLTFITELVEAGKVKPVIHRRYPLSRAADALSYIGEGHARGKIIITMETGEEV